MGQRGRGAVTRPGFTPGKEGATPTIAHVSDLHIGKDAAASRSARLLVQALDAAGIDQVLLTGDVTHRGRLEELKEFRAIFAPLAGRLSVVPGNHDRLGDDAARWLMRGRVHAQVLPGLYVVRLDSTAPHNRSLIDGHGLLTREDIAEVEAVLAGAPPESLVVLMLHHHVHRLPEDGLWERLSNLIGLPNATELSLGGELLERLAGRCDAILHGHRHAAGHLLLREKTDRPLRVLNAGSSTALGRVRVLSHQAGRILGERWLAAPAAVPGAPAADAAPAAA
jgi:3',5'-cyclic AMP phosphodiesterase CpdA